MKQLRFVMTRDVGLVLETPLPLNPMAREAARKYAEEEYTRRLRGIPSGDRRDALVQVISLLRQGNFTERPIPAHDCEQEAIIYG